MPIVARGGKLTQVPDFSITFRARLVPESPPDMGAVLLAYMHEMRTMTHHVGAELDYLYTGGRRVTMREAEAIAAVACWLAS